jgi:hypothetical protein
MTLGNFNKGTQFADSDDDNVTGTSKKKKSKASCSQKGVMEGLDL